MQVTIRRQQIEMPADVEQTLLRQISRAVQRFAGRVRKVIAYVGDINGPRGGVDKRCRLVADLAGAPCVTVEARDSAFGRLFTGATARLAQAVRRELQRRRDIRQRRRHGPASEVS